MRATPVCAVTTSWMVTWSMRLVEVELLDIALVDAVDLLRGECRGDRRRIVAEIDELQFIEIARRIGTALEHRLAADFELDKLEGFRAVRAHLEVAILGGIEHQEWIVEEMLRHRHLGFLEIEDQGLGILDLDRVGIPQFGRHHRIALVVLGAGVDFLQHIALHQADDGGADFRIEAVLDVPGGMLGGEVLALVPLGVLLDAQGPGLEVFRGLPLLAEMRAGHVVDAGAGEIAADLPHHVRSRRPRRRCAGSHLGDALGDLEDAALGQVLGHRGGCKGLTSDLAGPHIGRARRHAEQARIAHEFAPVDLLVGKLLLELGNPDMLFV